MITAVKRNDYSTLLSLLSSVTTDSSSPCSTGGHNLFSSQKNGNISNGLIIPPPSLQSTSQRDGTTCSSTMPSPSSSFTLKSQHHSVLEKRYAVSDFNKRDDLGNAPIHLAAWSRNEAIFIPLSGHRGIDVNSADYESLYTPMHILLYSGQLKLALGLMVSRRPDLTLKDVEGNTCLDLLNATLPSVDLNHGNGHAVPQIKSKSDTLPAWSDSSNRDRSFETEDINRDDLNQDHDKKTSHLTSKCAYSCWSWGSNHTFALGHSNSDDRVFPEQILFGAGSGCSRDTPNASSSSMPMVSTKSLSPVIESFQMSKFHTLILIDGRVWSSGYGAGGRLGLGHEETVLSPSLIEDLKHIIFICAGPYHSLAINGAGTLYSWGYNAHFALGYQCDKQLVPRKVMAKKQLRFLFAAASKFHTAAITTDGHVYTWGSNIGQLGYSSSTPSKMQLSPKFATLFPTHLVATQVAATNWATAVLYESHEVFVTWDDQISRVHFPFTAPLRHLRMHSAATVPCIIKLSSGNHQFAVSSNQGDVYMWSPPDSKFESSWQQSHFPQKHPRRVWNATKKHMAAVDFAIGIDSSLLICTTAGHVYSGVRRNNLKVKQKFKAAEKEQVMYKYTRIPFLEHVHQVAASTTGSNGAVRSDSRAKQSWPASIEESSISLSSNEYAGPDFSCLLDDHKYPRDVDVFDCSGQILGSAHVIVLVLCSAYLRCCFENLKDHVDNAWNEHNNIHISKDHQSGKYRIDVRGAIDSSFIPAFTKLLETMYYPNDDYASLSQSNVKRCSSFDNIFASKRGRSNSLICDWNVLCGIFKRTAIDVRSLFINHLIPLPDVCLKLSDNDELYAHRLILESASVFFRGAFSSFWKHLIDSDGRTIVSFPQFSLKPFKLILDWIYTGSSLHEAFRNLSTASVSEFIHEMLLVLEVAHLLLLIAVRDMIDVIFCCLIDVQNMCYLLEVSHVYNLTRLQNSSAEFVIRNLGTAFRDDDIFHLEPYLIERLEDKLRELQAVKFPYVRGEVGQSNGYYDMISRKVADQARSDKEKRRKAFLAQMATNYVVEQQQLQTSVAPQHHRAEVGSLSKTPLLPLNLSCRRVPAALADSSVSLLGDSMPMRKLSGLSIRCEEENIFEMEMDRPISSFSSTNLEPLTPTKADKGKSSILNIGSASKKSLKKWAAFPSENLGEANPWPSSPKAGSSSRPLANPWGTIPNGSYIPSPALGSSLDMDMPLPKSVLATSPSPMPTKTRPPSSLKVVYSPTTGGSHSSPGLVFGYEKVPFPVIHKQSQKERKAQSKQQLNMSKSPRPERGGSPWASGPTSPLTGPTSFRAIQADQMTDLKLGSPEVFSSTPWAMLMANKMSPKKSFLSIQMEELSIKKEKRK